MSAAADAPVTSAPSRGMSRELFLLAIPALAEQLLQFCVGLFDVFLSGQLGKEATSAVGLVAYVSWMGSMIHGLVGVGTTALVARAWGAGHFDEARKLTGRSMALALLMGGAVFSLQQSMAGVWPALMELTGKAGETATICLRIDAFSQLFSAWTLIGAAALRGSGDMRTPLLALGLTNIVNMIASSLLVFGPGSLPEMGATGIILGTVIAHTCGACVMLVALSRGWTGLKLERKEFRLDPDRTKRIFRIGGPAALDGVLQVTGHLIFLMIIGSIPMGRGTGLTMAAHTIGVRVESISYLPAVAYAYAAASIAGRRLGAGKPDEAMAAGNAAVLQCLGYAVLMTLFFYFGADQIYRVMNRDPEVAAIGVPAMHLLAFYQVPNAILIIYVGTLRGVGDTTIPLVCALIGNLLVRTTVAWFFGLYMGWGLFGTWIGMGADNILRCLILSTHYLRGSWTRKRI